MKTISVPLKNNTHNIVIGHNILSQLGARLKKLKIGKDALIITNPAINKHHGKTLIAGLKKSGFSVRVMEVPAGERSKSVKVAFRLIEEIAKYDCLKQVFVIAFGGGVIGDLAGYVAAAYKRGIPYVQVPTTLLAQVDSAIGGKVAIDLSVGKNLVGAFYQPKIVWSDVSVLSTLPERQMRNGLAEVVKYGVIADQDLFKYTSKNSKKLLDRDPQALMHIIGQSSRIKKNVVVQDEKETKGIRAKLNFGHTVGHAIEAAGQYRRYAHGEAVALGMRIAADISLQKRMCTKNSVIALNDLLTRIRLPEKIKKIRTADILSQQFLSDKLNSKPEYRNSY